MHAEKIVTCVVAVLVYVSASEVQAGVSSEWFMTYDRTPEEKTLGNVNIQTVRATEDKEKCNSTRRCQNGGKCEDGVCKCLTGTSDDFCQDVEGCPNRNCGINWAHCAYKVKNRRAECFCTNHNDYAYDEFDRGCRECNCGKYGDCTYYKSKMTCSCYESFAYYHSYYEPHTCKRCDCGLWSTGCTYKDLDKKCTCQNGFAPTLEYEAEKCERCYCGENGKCSFQYVDTGNINRELRKVCVSSEHYLELKGHCEECNCGEGVRCEFNDKGKKICHCPPGHGVKDGRCSACDCGLEAVDCTFNSKGNKCCLCPPGYEDRRGGQCEDVNECQNANVCPFLTRCENRNGTFDCDCAEGFQLLNGTDPKVRGCDDIDECKEKNVCSPNAVCVNTLGSYACTCIGQYTATYPDDSPSSTLCTDYTTDAWKIPGIVFIVLLAILSVFSIFLLYKNEASA